MSRLNHRPGYCLNIDYKTIKTNSENAEKLPCAVGLNRGENRLRKSDML